MLIIVIDLFDRGWQHSGWVDLSSESLDFEALRSEGVDDRWAY